ncbi:MAG: hypothetical protein ACFE8M_00620 [Candidatus Hermodarchaeota archaeon]
MTNLLEKALLTAFGIFILVIFISLIFPFWDQIIDYKGNPKHDYELYYNVINEFDQGILFIIENPNEIYQKNIYYPEKLNISTNGFYIKYEYLVKNITSYNIYQYDRQFLQTQFKDLPPQIYMLKIFYQLELIEIHLL